MKAVHRCVRVRSRRSQLRHTAVQGDPSLEATVVLRAAEEGKKTPHGASILPKGSYHEVVYVRVRHVQSCRSVKEGWVALGQKPFRPRDAILVARFAAAVRGRILLAQ